MYRALLLLTVLAVIAPIARADVPAIDPSDPPTILLAIAAVVAIGAALFAYARIVRRRAAGPPDASTDRRPDA